MDEHSDLFFVQRDLGLTAAECAVDLPTLSPTRNRILGSLLLVVKPRTAHLKRCNDNRRRTVGNDRP
jgi:hypothetical protein